MIYHSSLQEISCHSGKHECQQKLRFSMFYFKYLEIKIKSEFDKSKSSEANISQCSQVVSHPSTTWPQHCLTSVIEREPVHSMRYERWLILHHLRFPINTWFIVQKMTKSAFSKHTMIISEYLILFFLQLTLQNFLS